MNECISWEKLMYRGYYLLDAFTQKDPEEKIGVV